MIRNDPLEYYLTKIPGLEHQFVVDNLPLEEALQGYKRYKEKIAEYYKPDMDLKEKYPAIYEILIKVELNEKEIENITKNFYREYIGTYSETLDADDYDLN
jgi:hypothetical protein